MWWRNVLMRHDRRLLFTLLDYSSTCTISAYGGEICTLAAAWQQQTLRSPAIICMLSTESRGRPHDGQSQRMVLETALFSISVGHVG